MVVVYVVLAVAVAAAVYFFLFLRTSASGQRHELHESRSDARDPSRALEHPAAEQESAQPNGAAAPHKALASVSTPSAATGGAGTTTALVESPRAALVAAAKREGEGGRDDDSPVSHATGAISDSALSLRPDQPETASVDSDLERRVVASGPPSVVHVRNVEGIRRGLEKSRAKEGFFGRLVAIFAGKKELDPEIATRIEEVLLASDVGTKTTESLLAKVRDQLSRGELADSDAVWTALREEMLGVLSVTERPGAFSLKAKPTVVLLVGVNGVGKTTTIGKLATRLKTEGRQVILAAGDTFRAAAVQQLVVWGSRAGVEVIRGKDGADPGSVIFDAVQRAKETGADVVLADTAGRLHTKSNLMAELKKVLKTTSKALEGAPHEVLLVVDATNGQNAMAQAAEFQLAMPLTGVVLTKLDGTAKGGVVLGICDALRLPVRFVGLGETANDLHDFVPEEFVEALLGREN